MSATISMDGATTLFSSAITVQRLHGDIVNPADLRDRVVATVEVTPSLPSLNKLGAIVLAVEKMRTPMHYS